MSDVTRVGATEFARPNDTQMIATRVLDAPRDLVWAAHSQCDHARNWLLGGPLTERPRKASERHA
jgi:uncharacterized protein YndB with AHSA1/START domain